MVKDVGCALFVLCAGRFCGTTWYVKICVSCALFSGFNRSFSFCGPSFSKAALVGAKTVSGPLLLSVCSRPAALTAFASVENWGLDAASSKTVLPDCAWADALLDGALLDGVLALLDGALALLVALDAAVIALFACALALLAALDAAVIALPAVSDADCAALDAVCEAGAAGMLLIGWLGDWYAGVSAAIAALVITSVMAALAKR